MREHKLHIAIISITFLCTGLIYVFLNAATFYTSPSKKMTPTASHPVTSPTPFISNDEVTFFPKQPIFQSISIPVEDSPVENNTQYIFYKVGTIETGKYAGYDIVLTKYTNDWWGKYFGRRWPSVVRFLYKDHTAIILKQNSHPSIENPQNEISKALYKIGINKIDIDSNYTIQSLKYPDEIIGSNPNQKLQFKINNVINSNLTGNDDSYNIEDTAILNPDYLIKVFDSPYGTIYTTNPKIALTYEETSEKSIEKTNIDNDGLKDCTKAGCFSTNNFFLFRPDGTYLVLSYMPSIKIDEIKWSNAHSTDIYYSETRTDCTGQPKDAVSVSTNIPITDLTTIGMTKNSQEVYTFKNLQHPILKRFYQQYNQSLSEWYSGYSEIPSKRNYDEYVQSIPIFFIKDDWGRLLRYTNASYLQPMACEPIIYLYPEEKQEIKVQVSIPTKMTASVPKYENGWTVNATPDGTIYNDGKKYPYLFWEASSYPRELPKEGFISTQAELPKLLRNKLTILGLNQTERTEFIDAWLPKLNKKPYYLVHFISQEEIDQLIPLKITPLPKTTIRILVDFIPIEKPFPLVEQQLPETKKRNGFTVVEWGGLVR